MTVFPNRELLWIQPELLKKHFEFRNGDAVLGFLRWDKAWGSLASGSVAGSHWTFKRGGFLRPHVTVRQVGSPETLAVFEAGWNGAGILRYTDGPSYQWSPKGFWRTEWTWSSADGAQIASFKSDSRFTTKTEGWLAISHEAVGVVDLPLLAVLGWYLLVLSAEDTLLSVIAAGSS